MITYEFEPSGQLKVPSEQELLDIDDEVAIITYTNGTTEDGRYAWLGPWRYNPSEGLLLKFSGDLVYLVLIRGSNLDMPLNDGAINLTSGGLARQKIVWIREMGADEIRKVGEKGPTVDKIEIAELESNTAVKEWLSEHAPGFLH